MWEEKGFPELRIANYAPHVEKPILLVSGRWDKIFDLETKQSPFYEDLRCKPEDRVLVERGHILRGEDVSPAMDAWLENVFKPRRTEPKNTEPKNTEPKNTEPNDAKQKTQSNRGQR